MTERVDLMYKINLEDYMLPGIQMPWLEEFYESLRGHVLNVRQAGTRLGVEWSQLLIHDASKFTIHEFPAYARQFCGDKGDPAAFARAWLHHQNNNDHHWEYHILRSGRNLKDSTADSATGCLPMPNHCVREMVADWMGASMSYTHSWSIRDWWRKNEGTMHLHPNTRLVVRRILEEINYGD